MSLREVLMFWLGLLIGVALGVGLTVIYLYAVINSVDIPRDGK